MALWGENERRSIHLWKYYALELSDMRSCVKTYRLHAHVVQFKNTKPHRVFETGFTCYSLPSGLGSPQTSMDPSWGESEC